MPEPERLTAFEFVAFGDDLQLVRIKRGDQVLAAFPVHGWFGFFVPSGFDFVSRDDLTIEGTGVGRPYWNGEVPPWADGFDPVAERARIAQIRRAASELQARGSLLMM